ncbi:MAG: DUF882 domain-containing protein [Steroidobacteraceae bacterium]|jgi:uncharacterized protein YcbK (DUF882 family)
MRPAQHLGLPALSRRRLLALCGAAGCAVGLGCLPRTDAGTRRLVLRDPRTRTELDVEFIRGRAPVLAAIAQIDALFCDHGKHESRPVDPLLLDQLHTLAAELGAAPVFEIVAEHRPRGRESVRPGLHELGRAIDVRLAGVACADLAAAALALARGGVGYYRAADFVHLDTGSARGWRG